jgi:hypothetical protein
MPEIICGGKSNKKDNTWSSTANINLEKNINEILKGLLLEFEIFFF